MSLRAPSAWRGKVAALESQGGQTIQRSFSPKNGLLQNAAREVVDHPVETFAVVAAALAVGRALTRRKRIDKTKPRRRASSKGTLAIVAGICLLMLSACALAPAPTVVVDPNPESFGREYGNDLAAAGAKMAEQYCADCHPVHATGTRSSEAPALDTLLSRRDSDQLTDDLIAGLKADHGNMPTFDFNVIAALSLVAYLEDLDSEKPAKPL